MKHKTAFKVLTIVLLLVLVSSQTGLAHRLSEILGAADDATLSESDLSAVGGFSHTAGLSLESKSYPPSRLTRQDYYDAYQQAKTLLDAGIHFRSRELQRLDPATCVADPDNPDACRFSVTGIQSNYLDFNEGRLYWRFCADYDEPYVGTANIPHNDDDPDDELKIDPYGYCPNWDDLGPDQQTRRVADLGAGERDVRNTLIDARRVFFYLTVAPSSMMFDGALLIDDWTVNPDGTVTLGPDGVPDRVRDVGIGGMLRATSEVASAHMIYGNDFMVSALRFPFSTDGTDTEQIVRDEQRKLERALVQYQLAVDQLIYVVNYDVGGVIETGDPGQPFSTEDYVIRYFTPREYQLFSFASERMVTALTEIAKRERLLGADPAAGDQRALAGLNESFGKQYLQALALSSEATAVIEDDPATNDVDESKLNFLDNGGRDILNNLRRLIQQTENIRAGLNPLGYEDSFVPLRSFPDLMNLTCGGELPVPVCADNMGLLNSAYIAGNDLRNSQRTFDEKFDQLKAELTSLQYDFDDLLGDICGSIKGGDEYPADGLIDYMPCGLQDTSGNGYYEPGETSGLMGQSFWDMVAAQKRVVLAWRKAEGIAEQIRIEEQRAGDVIEVILGAADRIRAYQLAMGKAKAFKETYNVATSVGETGYLDMSFSNIVSNKTTLTGEGSFAGAFTSGIKNETSVENQFKTEAGMRFETSVIATSDLVWDPSEEIVAGYESLITLREAERDAQIEGANSAAVIKQLLLEQTQALIEVEIAQAELNRVIDEHNLLVEQYHRYLTQRAGTIAALQESYLSKPYFRLFRDGAALEAARTLDQATQAAYLAAKALEYYALSPISYLNELYRVRNADNLRAVLDRLARDYAAIPEQQFSKVTYRLSLAQDILGLTDANLNPDGSLTPAQVEQLRFERFQEFLSQNRYTVPASGEDKIAFAFGTTIDHPKFVHGVFNNRISRTSSSDPGCTAGGGCRGTWLNLITDQDPADFQGDWPKIKLVHGGHAVYRNGSLQEVSYSPGPAVFVGHQLPPGFGGDDRAALMTTHLNLDPTDAPDLNRCEDRFFNLSVATSQWIIEIDLTNPVENTILDLSQIRDIEIRMDSTYVTPSRNREWVAYDLQRVEAETAGRTVPEDVQAFLAAYEQQQAAARHAARSESQTVGVVRPSAISDRYIGNLFVNSPVQLGTFDIGFDLSIAPDRQISGSLCAECGPLYESPASLAGTYDPDENTFTFTTDTFTGTIAGRTAYRTITCQGEVQQGGRLLEGICEETVTGLTPRVIVSQGDFMVSGHSEWPADTAWSWDVYLPVVTKNGR